MSKSDCFWCCLKPCLDVDPPMLLVHVLSSAGIPIRLIICWDHVPSLGTWHSGITAAQYHQEHPDIQNQNTPSLHVPIRIPRGQNSLHPKTVSSRCKWQHKRGRPWHRQQLMFHVECTIYVQDCPSMSKCHGLCPGTDGEEKATVSHGHGESIRIKSNQFTNLDRQHADLISHIIICNQPIYQ